MGANFLCSSDAPWTISFRLKMVIGTAFVVRSLALPSRLRRLSTIISSQTNGQSLFDLIKCLSDSPSLSSLVFCLVILASSVMFPILVLKFVLSHGNITDSVVFISCYVTCVLLLFLMLRLVKHLHIVLF